MEPDGPISLLSQPKRSHRPENIVLLTIPGGPGGPASPLSPYKRKNTFTCIFLTIKTALQKVGLTFFFFFWKNRDCVHHSLKSFSSTSVSRGG